MIDPAGPIAAAPPACATGRSGGRSSQNTQTTLQPLPHTKIDPQRHKRGGEHIRPTPMNSSVLQQSPVGVAGFELASTSAQRWRKLSDFISRFGFLPLKQKICLKKTAYWIEAFPNSAVVL